MRGKSDLFASRSSYWPALPATSHPHSENHFGGERCTVRTCYYAPGVCCERDRTSRFQMRSTPWCKQCTRSASACRNPFSSGWIKPWQRVTEKPSYTRDKRTKRSLAVLTP